MLQNMSWSQKSHILLRETYVQAIIVKMARQTRSVLVINFFFVIFIINCYNIVIIVINCYNIVIIVVIFILHLFICLFSVNIVLFVH